MEGMNDKSFESLEGTSKFRERKVVPAVIMKNTKRINKISSIDVRSGRKELESSEELFCFKVITGHNHRVLREECFFFAVQKKKKVH